jgi:hypothetical protein
MTGLLNDAEDGNYSLTSFRDNLELMLSGTGVQNDEFAKLGVKLRLKTELDPTLKIIEITFPKKVKGAGFADSKQMIMKTKQYLLSYAVIE